FWPRPEPTTWPSRLGAVVEPNARCKSCSFIAHHPPYSSFSSTFTLCLTRKIIPRMAGLSCWITEWPILCRPSASMVAICFFRQAMVDLVCVIFSFIIASSSLAQQLFHGLAAELGHLFGGTQLLQALDGGLHHVHRVVGADGLGADVLDAHRLNDRADRAAGDHAGAFRSGHQQYLAGTEHAGDLVG